MPEFENQQSGMLTTNLDLIYCIDATGSMKPHIDETKNAAKTLYFDIQEALKNSARIVKQLRLKVIVFRDLSYDKEDAIKESRFFNLPDETAAYEEFINGIKAKGGGELPESSLEALHLAINSEWETSDIQDGATRRRHVIILFTDAPAHKLDDPEYREKAEKNTLYPKDCPSDLAGLIDEYNNMDERARRLVIFAPNDEPWPDLKENLNDCMMRYAQAAKGLDDLTNQILVNTIAKTVE